jgi:hypothetical protein
MATRQFRRTYLLRRACEVYRIAKSRIPTPVIDSAAAATFVTTSSTHPHREIEVSHVICCTTANSSQHCIGIASLQTFGVAYPEKADLT